MSAGYDGRAVANFLLDFCDRSGLAITNLALQKVVYFCHVWSLIELDRPLIRHKFEAWEYGPVLPYLYREFRTFDRTPILARARQLDSQDGNYRVVEYDFDSQTESLLLRVSAFYVRLRASDLVQLSHAEGSPWYKVWNHGGRTNPGMKIDNESIVEFYSRVALPFSVQ